MTGSLFSLPEIVEKLNHKDRIIAALKFDCEGCEYGAFKDIVTYEKQGGEIGDGKKNKKNEKQFNPIWSLSTEFHFSTTLGLRSKEDVANIFYTKIFLQSQGCKVFHYAPNMGYRKDRNVNPYLLTRGVVNGTCCYEYGFTCDRRVSSFGFLK